MRIGFCVRVVCMAVMRVEGDTCFIYMIDLNCSLLCSHIVSACFVLCSMALGRHCLEIYVCSKTMTWLKHGNPKCIGLGITVHKAWLNWAMICLATCELRSLCEESLLRRGIKGAS